ncbi:MAG: hypothetical protein U0165_20700 [Polyangiaceae bacterium]
MTRSEAIAAYIQARMQEEEALHGRGWQAKVAKATGVSSAHISNALNRGSIGNEFAHSMADFWHMPYAKLEQLALEKAGLAAPSTTVEKEPGAGQWRLRDLPGWAEAEAIAMTIFRLPPIAWDWAGQMVTRKVPADLSPEVVYKMADAWYTAMSDEERIEAHVEESRRSNQVSKSIREELRARGLDPQRDEVEWNLEFLKLKRKHKGKEVDEAALDALRIPPPGPVKLPRRLAKKGSRS